MSFAPFVAIQVVTMADITNLPKRKCAKDTVEAVKGRTNARTERNQQEPSVSPQIPSKK